MARLLRSFAPERLYQAINPWSFFQNAAFSLINIDMGRTPRPDIEDEILDQVGTYGRQIGRIGDALEVLLRHAKLEDMTQSEKDTLAVLRVQLADIRKIKERASARRPD